MVVYVAELLTPGAHPRHSLGRDAGLCHPRQPVLLPQAIGGHDRDADRGAGLLLGGTDDLPIRVRVRGGTIPAAGAAGHAPRFAGSDFLGAGVRRCENANGLGLSYRTGCQQKKISGFPKTHYLRKAPGVPVSHEEKQLVGLRDRGQPTLAAVLRIQPYGSAVSLNFRNTDPKHLDHAVHLARAWVSGRRA